MKPRNWEELSADEKYEIGHALVNSLRGRLILSQALHYAIPLMAKVAAPYTEVSNIEDMEILRETVFNFPITEHESQVLTLAKEKKDVEP